MSLTSDMAKVEQLAMRGYDADRITAAGIKIAPRTVAAIVQKVRTDSESAKRAVIRREVILARKKSKDAEVARERRLAELRDDVSFHTFKDILKTVADGLKVSEFDLLADGRTVDLAMARHEIMYLAAKQTTISFAGIGRLLRRDHSTVIAGIAAHARRNGLDIPRRAKPRPVLRRKPV